MVMIMPPYHGATIRVSEKGIYDFYAAVSDAIDIPIMFQDAPGVPPGVYFNNTSGATFENIVSGRGSQFDGLGRWTWSFFAAGTDGFVVYALGNFVFDPPWSTETQQGMLLEAGFSWDDIEELRRDGAF